MQFYLNITPIHEPYSKLYFKIHTFIQARPNSPDTWLKFAKETCYSGFDMEACALLDIACRKFGKSTGSKLARGLSEIPLERRGLGVSRSYSPQDIYEIPVWAQGSWFCPSPTVILRTRKFDGEQTRIALPFVQSGVPYCLRGNDSGLWLSHENTLYFSDDFMHFEIAESFERLIVNISQPLQDGSLLINLAPLMPCFAPDCVLIRPHQRALSLSSTQQFLTSDVYAMENVFLTCCGGMQANEIRFIYNDGHWKTKFIHEAPLLCIAHSPSGPLSIDKTGVAYLWHGERVISDFKLDLANILPNMHKSIEHYAANALPDANILILSNKHETLISDPLYFSDKMRSYIKQLEFYPNGVPTAALLGDENWHFWDNLHQCVDSHWQLPEVCATAENWKAILPTSDLSIEEDPRIRKTIY